MDSYLSEGWYRPRSQDDNATITLAYQEEVRRHKERALLLKKKQMGGEYENFLKWHFGSDVIATEYISYSNVYKIYFERRDPISVDAYVLNEWYTTWHKNGAPSLKNQTWTVEDEMMKAPPPEYEEPCQCDGETEQVIQEERPRVKPSSLHKVYWNWRSKLKNKEDIEHA